ncbi:aminotransferase class I/II-fold pyridoxal phosphate-dependent enzyme [Streptomyces sp. NPDC058701]|uniref:aminotransferase class I/II-fold pyridoxal phosphate-dependent enzyme n=1 Tax=Streptomyces sp. NPDC058701 TaxID=3346608 RepID=UPI003645F6EF
MSDLIRNEIRHLPDYQAIPDPVAVARELDIPALAKLDTNESAYGPLPGVLDAITEAAQYISRYPELNAAGLVGDVAGRYRLDPQGVVVGNGSAHLLEAVIKGVIRDGEEVLYSWRSFEAYPLIAAIAGATGVPVLRAEDYGHSLPDILAAITSRTRVVVLCNPSNPTGTYIPPDRVWGFVDQVPTDVVVVLDEAYYEFITPSPAIDSLYAAAQRPNVVVLRSFSKAWALAGLRIGWLYSSPLLARSIAKCIVPFSVNFLAQAAARAALHQEAAMLCRAREVAAERDRMVAALRHHTADIPSSQGNFLWLPLYNASLPFAVQAKKWGFLVRAFDGEGVRVTIGTTMQNTRFVINYPDIMRHARF